MFTSFLNLKKGNYSFQHRITLMLTPIVLILAYAFVPWIMADVNRRALVESYQNDDYTIAFEGLLRADDQSRRIFVFQSVYQGWPGDNHQVIVLTDAAYGVVAVQPSTHESMFLSAKLKSEDGRESLEIRRSIRPGFQTEALMYKCVGGRMHKFNRTVDPPEIELPDRIDLRGLPRIPTGKTGDP